MGGGERPADTAVTETIAHPRDTFDLIGQETAERVFVEAIDRGRLHHAWLLTGSAGVGKASFAYMAARRLLGAAPHPAGPLASRPDHPVSRQISARAHPDLLAIQRLNEEGKSRRDIPVEEVRELGEFFAKSAAQGMARVAIVDDADHLNAFGVNALLKILEEPPPRGLLFLVCAVPGRLPATIRSRCRRLRFSPPAPEIAEAWLADRAGVTHEVAAALLVMAGGAPGRAWRLAQEGALEMDAAAADILARLPATNDTAVQALADGFRGAAGAVRFNIFIERLAVRVHQAARSRIEAGENLTFAEPWADAFTELTRLPSKSEAINLDRSDVLYATLSRLAGIAG